MSRNYNVAIVGATGLVGKEMRAVLEERKFPVANLSLLASERSAGEVQSFHDEALIVTQLNKNSFDSIDIALFSAGADVSQEYAPIAAKAGAIVIDNSAAWRMEKDVPLVVPEVNPGDVGHHKGIIANPNCSTIQLVVALNPLHQEVRIRRLVVSTYQSVSGMGSEALDELLSQSISVVNFQPMENRVFPRQMAFNVLPECGTLKPEGWTSEEFKLILETRKILHEPDLPVVTTAVRVPVFIGHAETVFVEFEEELTPARARELWSNAPGVVLLDDLAEGQYPTPAEVAGRDETFIGRIRRDPSTAHGLCFFVVADNLRKGAATNAVQIAEEIVQIWEN